MGGMAGFNVMYPLHWFASEGDHMGDAAHNVAYAPDGNFFNNNQNPTAHANSSDPASAGATIATGAASGIGIYAGYVNQAAGRLNSQAPLDGGPVLMNGPLQGPHFESDFARMLPRQYVSAAAPWKSAPMQYAGMGLPIAAQVAVHATGDNPPATDQLPVTGHTAHSVAMARAAGAAPSSAVVAGTYPASHATGAAGYVRSSPRSPATFRPRAATPAPGGGCGCGGGCGGGGQGGMRRAYCQGKNQAIGLDSAHDFPPLYSHPAANQTQVVNAALYHQVSMHHAGWTVSSGAAPDHEQPVQGI